MKVKKKVKILLVSGLIFGLATPSMLNANEIEEDTIDSVEDSKQIEEVEDIESDDTKSELINETTDVEVEDTQEEEPVEVKETNIIQATAGSLVANQTTLEEAFPDVNFRTYIAQTILGKTTYVDESDKGSVLTTANISKITARTALDVANKNIESLDGIKHFTSLTTLYCHNNQLTTLDVSGLSSLKTMYSYNNQLTALNVSGLTNLEILRTQTNNLTELDLTTSTSLKELLASDNQIASLKVTGLSNLATMNISNNKLTGTLDLRSLSSLATVSCFNNQLTSLDVSGLTSLKTLYSYNNQLTSLNVSGTTALESLRTQINQLTTLDVTESTALKELLCQNNMLTTLRVAGLSNLATINCGSNAISGKLDVSGLNNLSIIYCEKNQITELDLSAASNVTVIRCYSNPITNLVISPSAKTTLSKLYYHYTNVPSLDLSGYNALTILTATKSENVNFDGMTDYYFSGSRSAGTALVSVAGDSGFISWDAAKGYYVINADMNAVYGFAIPYEGGNAGDYLGMTKADYLDLSEGALMDSEGNLIIGAKITDVENDGSVNLANGGTIVSGEGTYTFEGNTTIKDGSITTDGNFTFEKNTATYDEEQGKYVPNLGEIGTTVEVGNGEVTINTETNEMGLPGGSAVIDNDGNKTYLPTGGVCDSDGNVSSDGTIITVPSDVVNQIIENEDGTVTLPAGTIVTDENGNQTVTDKPIVYNPSTGEIIDDSSLSISDDYNDNDGVIVTPNIYDLQLTINGQAITGSQLSSVTWKVENIAGFASDLDIAEVTSGTSTVTMKKSGIVKVTATYQGAEASIVVIRTGDIDRDGETDYIDIANLVDYIISGNLNDLSNNTEYYEYFADINQDGQIDYTDLADLVDMINGGI